jgi:hypothetical protein
VDYLRRYGIHPADEPDLTGITTKALSPEMVEQLKKAWRDTWTGKAEKSK